MRRGPIRPDLVPALTVGATAAAVTILLGLLARQAAPDPALTPLIDSGARLYYVVAAGSAAGLALLAVVRGAVEQAEPGGRDWRLGVEPGLAALAGLMFFVWHHHVVAILLVPLAVGAIAFLDLALPHLVAAQRERVIVHDAVAVAVLYAVVAMILSFRVQPVLGAAILDSAAVAVAAAVVVLSRLGSELYERRVIRAAGLGLVSGQIVWALNYLNVSHWVSAVPIVAAAAIGCWQVRRDEQATGNHPRTAHSTESRRQSEVRPGQ